MHNPSYLLLSSVYFISPKHINSNMYVKVFISSILHYMDWLRRCLRRSGLRRNDGLIRLSLGSQ